MNVPMQKIGMSDIKIEFISVFIEVKNRSKAAEMVRYLKALAKSNPAVKVVHNPGVEEKVYLRVINVPGIQELHTEDVIEQLERDTGIEVTPKNPERKVDTEIVTKIVGATFLFAHKLIPIARKTIENDGYEATLLAVGEKRLKNWNKAQHPLFKYIPNAPKLICESRYMTEINKHNLNEEINICDLFKVGSKVDASGKTIGRGFSGAMKRHNFKGLRATHGVTKAHRSHGSTGHRSLPARVFKGKKMAGRYGNENITTQSLQVVLSDTMNISGHEGYVIAVIGSVPGFNGSTCFIAPAVKGSIQ